MTWDRAEPNRLAVVNNVVLSRTWPSHAYLDDTGVEIYVQAGELNDAARGGDIWNMELYDNLQCRFFHSSEQPNTLYTIARYFNKTHIGCPLPTYQVEGAVEVDITYDQSVTFSQNTVPIHMVPAPEIKSLNNTAYYYTHHEQVYIELRGRFLSRTTQLYVRVGDHAQSISHSERVVGSEDDEEESIVFLMPI